MKKFFKNLLWEDAEKFSAWPRKKWLKAMKYTCSDTYSS